MGQAAQRPTGKKPGCSILRTSAFAPASSLVDLPEQHGSGLGLGKRLRAYLRNMLGPMRYPQPFANGGCWSCEAESPYEGRFDDRRAAADEVEARTTSVGRSTRSTTGAFVLAILRNSRWAASAPI
jgi:hypothetical protein